MNHEEVRGVFHDALGETPPLPRNDTDDIISAGRRVVGRRRAWRTSGAVAGITAVVALVGFALQQGGARPVNDAAAGSSSSPATSGSDWYIQQGNPDPEHRYQNALRDVLAARFPGQTLVKRPLIAAPGDVPDRELLEFGDSTRRDGIGMDVIVHFPTGDPTWLMVNVEPVLPHDGGDEDYLREIGRCEEESVDCHTENGPNGELIVWRGGVDSNDGGEVKNVAIVLRGDGTVVRVKALVFTPDDTSLSAGDGTSTLPQVTVDDVKAIALALPMAPTYG
ncbi:hypothetical protein Afil01_55800 [Actinorhabdospora filicis]|uniref:Uncharacterized protein n=1 Tax=Actinorhabdospora filicis TaxID=1785913 RepID=A0A9W6SRI9_9ACTN|nr:hypothetical protein [Actinorhabdospora filicis]GLZ80773.1 hypothetical protein Afil01_55800 [Actinorhabdospora filicis]